MEARAFQFVAHSGSLDQGYDTGHGRHLPGRLPQPAKYSIVATESQNFSEFLHGDQLWDILPQFVKRFAKPCHPRLRTSAYECVLPLGIDHGA